MCSVYNKHRACTAVCTKIICFVDGGLQAGYNVSIKAEAHGSFRQIDDMDNVVLASATQGRRGGDFFIAFKILGKKIDEYEKAVQKCEID